MSRRSGRDESAGSVFSLPRGLRHRHRERVLPGRRPRAAGGQLARRVWVGILGDACCALPLLVCAVYRCLASLLACAVLRDAPRTAAYDAVGAASATSAPVWRRRGPWHLRRLALLASAQILFDELFRSTLAAAWSGSRRGSAGSWRSAAVPAHRLLGGAAVLRLSAAASLVFVFCNLVNVPLGVVVPALSSSLDCSPSACRCA